jgi:DNA-binding transcriptional LysR family regulator
VDFGVYAEDPQPPAAVLSDITALASLALAYPDRTELQRHLPDDLLAAYSEHGLCPAIRATQTAKYVRRRLQLPRSPLTAAVAALIALQILEKGHVAASGQAMSWLIRRPGQHRPAASPRTTVGVTARTSAIFEAVQIKAFAPMLGAPNQLRYKSMLDFPTPPANDAQARANLARSVPSMLWPHWCLRMAPPGSGYAMPGVLACALLMVGTVATVAEVVADLGSIVNPLAATHVLTWLSRQSRWRHVSIALAKLNEYLNRRPPPIDYARRRTLDYADLLPERVWRRLCRDSQTKQGGAGKSHAARCYLFEMISGLPARRFPGNDLLPKHVAYHRAETFALALTPHLAAGLQAAGRHFLDRLSIQEPLTWYPPLSLLDGLDLPGSDPALVDIDALHRLANNAANTIQSIAGELNSTSDVVTHLLIQHPAGADISADGRPRRSKRGAALREAMTAQTLTELYHHQGLSISAIAKLFGTSSFTVRGIAADQQIKLQRFEIRQVPEVLLSAVSGQGGRERLQRFATIIEYPNMRAAAAALNIHIGTVGSQIHRLERDLGAQLLDRDSTDHPMMPTPFGREIAQATRDWLNADLGAEGRRHLTSRGQRSERPESK